MILNESSVVDSTQPDNATSVETAEAASDNTTTTSRDQRIAAVVSLISKFKKISTVVRENRALLRALKEEDFKCTQGSAGVPLRLPITKEDGQPFDGCWSDFVDEFFEISADRMTRLLGDEPPPKQKTPVEQTKNYKLGKNAGCVEGFRRGLEAAQASSEGDEDESDDIDHSVVATSVQVSDTSKDDEDDEGHDDDSQELHVDDTQVPDDVLDELGALRLENGKLRDEIAHYRAMTSGSTPVVNDDVCFAFFKQVGGIVNGNKPAAGNIKQMTLKYLSFLKRLGHTNVDLQDDFAIVNFD